MAFVTSPALGARRNLAVRRCSVAEPVKARLSDRGARAARMAGGGQGEKPKAPEADDPMAGYWPGELVCADCGFVYDNLKKKRKFEDLPDGWVCPQCNASKRRFARKVGDFVEKTAGTDNTPIIVFSVAGLVGTLAFFVWASQNL